MPKKENPVPKAVAERILRNAGAARVGEDGKGAFADALLAEAEKICSRAAQIAKHAGRRTILAEDIKLAIK